jgi:hypothetical protein
MPSEHERCRGLAASQILCSNVSFHSPIFVLEFANQYLMPSFTMSHEDLNPWQIVPS